MNSLETYKQLKNKVKEVEDDYTFFEQSFDGSWRVSPDAYGNVKILYASADGKDLKVLRPTTLRYVCASIEAKLENNLLLFQALAIARDDLEGAKEEAVSEATNFLQEETS